MLTKLGARIGVSEKRTKLVKRVKISKLHFSRPTPSRTPYLLRASDNLDIELLVWILDEQPAIRAERPNLLVAMSALCAHGVAREKPAARVSIEPPRLRGYGSATPTSPLRQC